MIRFRPNKDAPAAPEPSAKPKQSESLLPDDEAGEAEVKTTRKGPAKSRKSNDSGGRPL